jgi:hypothetical protein
MKKKQAKDPVAMRLDWLRRKHEKAITDNAFANGYRAGLDCAIRAITEGEDVLGYSIDDGKADIR